MFPTTLPFYYLEHLDWGARVRTPTARPVIPIRRRTGSA